MSGLVRQAINLALAGLIAVVALGDRQTLMTLLQHVSPPPEA
jgi:hypothetical protein